MQNSTPVVILNMHYTGIGIARSLYGKGIKIIGLGTSSNCFGANTKFCEFKIAPDSYREPDKLSFFLINLAKDLDQTPILLPTRDYDVLFIADFLQKLEKYFYIPQAKPKIIKNIIEKDKLYNIAIKNKILCPSQISISNLEELYKNKLSINFPCVAKPISSSSWRSLKLKNIVGNKKAIPFDNFDDLYTFYEKISEHDPNLIIQEKILGAESNIYIFGAYVSKDQSSIYYYTARKLMQYPQGFGTGIILESCTNKEIVESSKKLLQLLDYSGLCEIEYKFSPSNKKFYLIEINTRHWDQHLLSLSSNINLTEMLYRDWTENILPKPNSEKCYKLKWIADQELPFAVINLLITRKLSIKSLYYLLNGKKQYGSIDFRDIKLCFYAIKSCIVTLLTLIKNRLVHTTQSNK